MSSQSGFLNLPVEIRLQIYEHCCAPNGPITLSSWRVPAWWPNNIHPKSQRIPGIHKDHMPIASQGYDRAVLEGRPALGDCECVIARSTSNIISMFPEYYDSPSTSPDANGAFPDTAAPFRHRPSNPSRRKPSVYMLPAGPSPSNQSPPFLHPTEPSLHLTCRQIHRELALHRSLHSERGAKTNRRLDLYLSFPDGVCLAVHRYPHLLHRARAIYIAGISDLIGVENPSNTSVFERSARGPEYPFKSRVPSLEEEQADALRLLVLNIHRLGARALAAAKRDLALGEPTTGTPATSTTSSSAFEFPRSPSARQTQTHEKPSLHIRIIYPATLLNRRPHNLESINRTNPYAHFAIGYAAAASHDPYRDVWGHKFSPITTAFAAMGGGEIKVSISRGTQGVGVDLVARGNGGVRRYVDSRLGGRLEISREGEGEMWRWLVLDEWGREEEIADEAEDYDNDDDDDNVSLESESMDVECAHSTSIGLHTSGDTRMLLNTHNGVDTHAHTASDVGEQGPM